MAKGKVVSSSSGNFAKGGKTKMFGQQSAGPQVPGQSAQDEKGKTGVGARFAKGGNTKMFGKQAATPKVPGKTGK